jgi:hypothetical protein
MFLQDHTTIRGGGRKAKQITAKDAKIAKKAES